MIQKRILKNNVVLITQDVPSSKSVAIGFYYLDAGSRYESEGERGLSHFCEHMLFKGTQNLSTHDIAVMFDRMGGYVNAFTERDDVCTYCLVPAMHSNLEKALDCFCQMSSSCTFIPQEMENERTVVQNEITAVQDDAEECALDSLSSFMWPNQALGKTITGTALDVDSITREGLLDWYQKKFVHGELVVVICGSLEKSDILMAEQKLLSLPCRKKPLSYPAQLHAAKKAEWESGSVFKADSRFSSCQIYLLYPFKVPLTHEEFSALAVINALTGDSMSSRLFENIREKNGSCYSTYSFFTAYEDTAFWGSVATCNKKNAVKIANLLQDQMRSLVTNPPGDEEIAMAKEHIEGEEFLAGEDMESLMKRNFRHYAMGLELYDTPQVLDSIRAVQKNVIIDFINRMSVEKNRILFVYGPKLSARQKKEILCRTK